MHTYVHAHTFSDFWPKIHDKFLIRYNTNELCDNNGESELTDNILLCSCKCFADFLISHLTR